MNVILALLMIICSGQVYSETLSEGIPFPFYETNDEEANQVMSIDNGLAALELRLQMIRRATKTIELEYFEFHLDQSSKLLTLELIAAAKRGVKIRMLIDKARTVFVFNKYYSKELSKFGIEVRYYNNASLVRLITVQYRSHRKLLTVDDQEALTGGRNIGDSYFEMSSELNYDDRDIYIKGPLSRTIRLSFDAYFEHKISERPKFPESGDAVKTQRAEEFMVSTELDRKARAKVAEIGNKVLSRTKLHVCPTITFSTDAPGSSILGAFSEKYISDHRYLRRTLRDKISLVDKSIFIASPYYINNSDSRDLINTLLEKGVEVNIFTNSLSSSDAVYMSANFYRAAFRWVRKGVNISLHNGDWPEYEYLYNEDVKTALWGTHSKTQIYETSTYSEVMIGTYNIHNRSSIFDAEMAVFCKGNDEFTREVKASMLKEAKKGIVLNDDNTATDKHGDPTSIFGSSKHKLFKMKLLHFPSWLIKYFL